MATCRECIHNNVCETLALEYEISNETSRQVENRLARNCDDFKNKSDYVKRERGEWKYLDIHCNFAHCSGKIKCTNCGAVIRRLTGVNYNFCPYCSADMRKEDNNDDTRRYDLD